MSERLETQKYVFTVEGETERWYLLWLKDQINACENRTHNVSIDPRVQQSPKKFFKGVTAKTIPAVTHALSDLSDALFELTTSPEDIDDVTILIDGRIKEG